MPATCFNPNHFNPNHFIVCPDVDFGAGGAGGSLGYAILRPFFHELFVTLELEVVVRVVVISDEMIETPISLNVFTEYLNEVNVSVNPVTDQVNEMGVSAFVVYSDEVIVEASLNVIQNLVIERDVKLGVSLDKTMVNVFYMLEDI